MYIINKDANRIEKIETSTFKQLGFKERDHLQEWIANNPECLNEELLIIQKEFDGFNDTYERLDLLALDKQGNLVIIENKLDDTGKDVTWQVQKYASYCSTLNSGQIISIFNEYLAKIGNESKAEDLLSEFLENEDFKEHLNIGNSQRMILIAGEFRKEVTSTVLWLLNYGLRIQCFKATPYKLNDQIFLNMEQIIPVVEAEEFIISMANKSREEVGTQEEMKEKNILRRKFWVKFLKEVNKVSSLYQNVSPSKYHWLTAGSGVSGVTYNTVVTRDYIHIELTISGKAQDENKLIYDTLHSNKEDIEKSFGHNLKWERLDTKRMSRISCELDGVDVSKEDDWDKMIAFIVTSAPKFEATFKGYLATLQKKIIK